MTDMIPATISELMYNMNRIIQNPNLQKQVIEEFDKKGFYADFSCGLLRLTPKNVYISSQIKENLNLLSDEERLDIIRKYCTSCGSKNKDCQCWNDE